MATTVKDLVCDMDIDPATAAGFYKVAVTGANRITIDPFGFDLRSTTTFNRIIQAHKDWTAPCKSADQ